MSLTDQLSHPDNTGPDPQLTISTTHPSNIQKNPMPPCTVPPSTLLQSTSSLQVQSHLKPQGLSSNTKQTHGQVNVQSHSHSMPPPYKINTEDLNKEDVIFF